MDNETFEYRMKLLNENPEEYEIFINNLIDKF